VEKDIRDYNKENLKIDRIYERGEILAILRAFTNFVYKPSAINPSIRQKAIGRVSPTQNRRTTASPPRNHNSGRLPRDEGQFSWSVERN
jgi:hypothetical protein